jgi:hypothetical protein
VCDALLQIHKKVSRRQSVCKSEFREFCLKLCDKVGGIMELKVAEVGDKLLHLPGPLFLSLVPLHGPYPDVRESWVSPTIY